MFLIIAYIIFALDMQLRSLWHILMKSNTFKLFDFTL